MRLHDIDTKRQKVSLFEAIFQGLASNGSLFMPTNFPRFDERFIEEMHQLEWNDLTFEVAKALIGQDIPERTLRRLTEKALDFPVPLVLLNEQTGVLELFHGPSMAFKDFGARFMAGLMSFFLEKKGGKLHILVATSGDTGGAVAAGFYDTNIKVTILYPSEKVSPLQEKQLTTWGKNIKALEIEGTFDDCQALVKRAFADPDLKHLSLSSANSINIARLIPQTFYYFEGYRQAKLQGYKEVLFSVPSGNFGNLTAGLWAKKMGLPVHHFIAATNLNRIVPDYLESGTFSPKSSIPTLSNAMDVGNPSNFSRMLFLYGSTWNHKETKDKRSTWNTNKGANANSQKDWSKTTWQRLKEEVSGFSFSDEETLQGIRQFLESHNYLFDPHGVLAMLAWQKWKNQRKNKNALGIVLETAHPAKFLEVIKRATGKSPNIPERLKVFLDKEKQSLKLKNDYKTFKEYLQST